MFWIYYRALAPLHAFERVQSAFGTAHAIGMVFAKKGDGLPDALRGDLADAYLAPPG